jgi:hypothetical protein
VVATVRGRGYVERWARLVSMGEMGVVRLVNTAIVLSMAIREARVVMVILVGLVSVSGVAP